MFRNPRNVLVVSLIGVVYYTVSLLTDNGPIVGLVIPIAGLLVSVVFARAGLRLLRLKQRGELSDDFTVDDSSLAGPRQVETWPLITDRRYRFSNHLVYPRPRLRLGERFLRRTDGSMGGRIWHGGRIYVTTERLVFVPNAIDGLFRGSSWQIDRSQVRTATVEVRATEPLFERSSRVPMLRVSLTDGTSRSFACGRDPDRCQELAADLGFPQER